MITGIHFPADRKETERQEQEKLDARRGGARGRGRGRARGRGRGRGRARVVPANRGRQTRGGANADVGHHVLQIESDGEGADNDNPIIINSDLGANEVVNVDFSDSSSDPEDSEPTDSEPESDGEYAEGIPGAYFGGYGYCFSCGK